LRVPGYPAVPSLFAGAAAILVTSTLLTTPRESLIGLAFIALGIPSTCCGGGTNQEISRLKKAHERPRRHDVNASVLDEVQEMAVAADDVVG
jgi:hypothetical protein